LKKLKFIFLKYVNKVFLDSFLLLVCSFVISSFDLESKLDFERIFECFIFFIFVVWWSNLLYS